MAVLDCTVASINEKYPCMACGNRDEIEGLIIYLLQTALSLDHDVNDAVADADCFVCLSDTQMLEAFAKILVEAYGEEADLGSLSAPELIKCWKCVQPKQRRAVILRLFCLFFASRAAQ